MFELAGLFLVTFFAIKKSDNRKNATEGKFRSAGIVHVMEIFLNINLLSQ
jgi:hypothetical protein